MATGKVVAESVALVPRSGGSLSLAQWCHLFFFMASGIATPLLVGFVKRQGACGVRTMFSVFPNYVVMILTVCGNWRARHRGRIRWRAVAAATVVDAVSQGANYSGLLLAGSGTYIVIYSSVTLWVAVLSRAERGAIIDRDVPDSSAEPVHSNCGRIRGPRSGPDP